MNEPEKKDRQEITISEKEKRIILKIHEDVRPGLAS
jgi:hypothetical protein